MSEFSDNLPRRLSRYEIWQKTRKALRLAIDAIKTNHQSDGHGLPVRSLRTQSSLPTEKQQA